MLPTNDLMVYSDFNIVFQEIPNEISICYTISGCNLGCTGCHSSYTWKERGTRLTDEDYHRTLKKYENLASTVLFMGGEWKEIDLINKLSTARKMGYNTALYTGLEKEELSINIYQMLDFLKTGRWKSELGGLNSKNTNQKLIDLRSDEELNYLFWN